MAHSDQLGKLPKGIAIPKQNSHHPKVFFSVLKASTEKAEAVCFKVTLMVIETVSFFCGYVKYIPREERCKPLEMSFVEVHIVFVIRRLCKSQLL